MRTTTRDTDRQCTHGTFLAEHCEGCDGPLTNSQRRVREDLTLLQAQAFRLQQHWLMINSYVTSENRLGEPVPPHRLGDIAAELEALASGILDVAHDLKDLSR